MTSTADQPFPAPARHITASSLKRRVGIEAVAIPLLDTVFGHVSAYTVHCSTGPYLMTVKEWETYHHRTQPTA
jgi:hypothetical protein